MADRGEKVGRRRPISKGKRYDVLRKSGFRCHYCGARASEVEGVLQVDHMVPVSKGGTNKLENLVAACEACNIGKRDKLIGTVGVQFDPQPMIYLKGGGEMLIPTAADWLDVLAAAGDPGPLV